ncbi:MAG: hypothetical protein G01um101416_722 [Microgenomates group bacterium Gr01-1014_16]|nr:MAG: hypothetical protein G01um101416_722 [Microgenomates group bacterium Gr01-1014_16]
MAVNYALQDQFLKAFFSSRLAPDFYLTGGTALARFYFHHRESIDLDLFTHNRDMQFDQVNITTIDLSQKLNLTIEKQTVTDTYLQYIFKEGLKVELVKDIPVHFGEFKMEGNIRLDSIENIGSNKVLAIFGRIAAKDFIDLYYILKNTTFTLDYLYQLASKKDIGLTEFYLANSMDKIQEAAEYPVLLKPLDKHAMVKFFQDTARKLLLKIKPLE